MNVKAGIKGFVTIPLEERFWANVHRTETCWLWTGPTQSEGRYGMIWKNGRNRRAHHIAWELENGAIPDGLCVCHHCDVTLCVRPAHLFVGTRKDNTQDAKAKGRLKHGTQPQQEYCKKGLHLMTGDNVVKASNYGRRCRACRIENSRQWRAKHPAPKDPLP